MSQRGKRLGLKVLSLVVWIYLKLDKITVASMFLSGADKSPSMRPYIVLLMYVLYEFAPKFIIHHLPLYLKLYAGPLETTDFSVIASAVLNHCSEPHGKLT